MGLSVITENKKLKDKTVTHSVVADALHTLRINN